MKQTLCCLAITIGLGLFTKEAQSQYTLNTSIGSYSDVSGSTSINKGNVWDYAEYAFPIGFEFDLLGMKMDSLYMDNASLLYFEKGDNVALLSINHALLTDRGVGAANSLSPLSYKIEGTAGNRIFKLELKNVGFLEEYDEKGTTNDFANIQLWLYEKGNVIEIKHGASKITNAKLNYDGFDGPSIGFILITPKSTESYMLSGSPNSPTLLKDTTGEEEEALTSTPANGTTYRFEKTTSGYTVKSTKETVILLMPNPASSFIQVTEDLQGAEYTVFDIVGRLVLSGTLSTSIIDVQSLEQGVYQVCLKTGNSRYTSKFVKQ